MLSNQSNKPEQFTFFWQGGSPFSQWHRSSFTINGITFNCAEQWMMYSKALLFNDVPAAKAILKESNPKDQKALGRIVRGFDSDIWERECRRIVYEGNHAKFTQNPHLLNQLLATAPTTLVEASPYDRIWGIGLRAEDPAASDRSRWRGQNLLGFILTELRDNLLREQART